MKKKTILLMFISFILLFVSCGKTPSTEPTQNKTPTEQQTETFDEGYTLSFNVMGHGSAQASIDNIKSIPSVLPSLSAEGYIFDGWYVDEACTKKVELGLKLNQDTTLYAKWTKVEDTETPVTPTPIPPVTEEPVTPEPTPTPVVVKYTVTFNSNGGSTVASAEVEQNNKVSAPTAPIKEGYTFAGWFSDEALTKAWKFDSDVVTANTTLYAKWEEVVAPVKKYSVTFNINGHGDQPAEVNDVLALPLELPVLTADGYTFLGWYTDEALTSKAVSGTDIKADTILYASWKLNTYKITYHINGHGNQPAEVTDVLALPTELPVLSEKGWTFLGWFMDENFSVAAVADAELTADVTLYAKWEKESVNIVTTNFFTALQYEEYTDESIKDVDGIYKIIFNSDEVDVTGERYYNLNTNITLNQGYTIIWYADKDNYSSQLVTQRAHLEYGDNIYYATITNMNGQFLASYAFNIYVLHDYYFNYYEFQYGYKLANQHKPYYTERVIEGECTSLYKGTENGFNFKGWLTIDFQTRELVKYDFTQPTYRNVEFFASYEDVEITLYNQKNNFSPFLTDKLDINVSSTIDNLYDGWYYNGIQYINEENEIVTSISHYQLISNISIEYVKETQSKFFKFNEVNDGYCINLVKMPSYTDILILPSEYNGKPVVTLGSTSFNDKEFNYIYIPNTVTRLEQGTLNGCSSLENVTLPFVGDNINLSKDTYQYPLGYIFGTNNYDGSKGTTQYCYDPISKKSTWYTYYIPSSLKKVTILGGNITYGAFSNCRNLISIVIDDSVTSVIGNLAFYGCDNLIYNIYDNAKYIGNEKNPYLVLVKATSIDIITCKINENTKFIHSDAFSSCSNLTSIIIPDSVTSIGSYALSKCTNLTSMTLPYIPGGYLGHIFGADSYLENSSYVPKSLKEVIITGGTSIGSHAFSSCSNLTSVVIGDSVTSISSYAFHECSNLKNVKVDEKNIVYDSRDNCNAIIETSTNTLILGCQSTVIPVSVTSIGSYAFSSCSNLTNITIPDSVTSIGSYAFSSCSNLTSIKIPDSVTSIEKGAFYDCTGLTSITIPYVGATLEGITKTHFGYIFGADSYLENSSYVPKSLKEVIITGGTNIGNYAFSSCSNITNITIPDSVTSIGSYAFSSCSNLKSVVIGDSVTSIGSHAFSSCSNLTSIEIPDLVTSIGSYAFLSCSYLTSVVIGDSVTSIGEDAFKGCYRLVEVYNLSSINIEKGSTSNGYIGYNAKVIHTSIEESILIEKDNYVFYKDSNKYYLINYKGNDIDIKLPDNINGYNYSIVSYAFSSCSNLTSIVIPDSVTSIEKGAFYDCTGLTSITIPYVGATLEGITKTHFGYIFGADSYLENSSYVPPRLKEVIITGGTSIDIYAFYNCSCLTSIVILDSVTSIGSHAFYLCMHLKSIVIPDSVTSIGSDIFYYYGRLTNVYWNGTIGDWCNISFSDYDSNPMYYVDNFYILDSNGDMEYQGNKYTLLTEAVIPNTVTSISSYAFYKYSNLTSVVIGDSVTSIGEDAFNGCGNLKSVVIGNSVTSIGSMAFYSCSNLTSIVIPDSVTSIRTWAFKGCSNLKSVVIGDSVTRIGYDTFGGCSSMESITIPFVGMGLYGCDTTALHFGYIFGADSYSENSNYVPTSLKEVIIKTATYIYNNAFYGCINLTSIVIPNSVKSIGSYAFYGCTSLKKVYYKGSSMEWNNITRGDYNSPLISATRYYYLETEPTTSGKYWHYDADGNPVVW